VYEETDGVQEALSILLSKYKPNSVSGTLFVSSYKPDPTLKFVLTYNNL